jgi:hypothetical protein
MSWLSPLVGTGGIDFSAADSSVVLIAVSISSFLLLASDYHMELPALFMGLSPKALSAGSSTTPPKAYEIGLLTPNNFQLRQPGARRYGTTD